LPFQKSSKRLKHWFTVHVIFSHKLISKTFLKEFGALAKNEEEEDKLF
jgi:hypothetical protein